jgi:hypothetical protein
MTARRRPSPIERCIAIVEAIRGIQAQYIANDQYRISDRWEAGAKLS